MAIEIAEQYKPLSTDRTTANDALDVAAVRDLAEGLNNYIFNVVRFPFCFVGIDTAALYADLGAFERVYGSFGARDFGLQFNQLRFTACHAITTGGAAVTWTIYCGPQLYRGPEGSGGIAFDTDFLGLPYESATFDSLTAEDLDHGSGLPIVRNSNGGTYLTITAEPADGATRAVIRSLTITPYNSSY